MRGLITSGLVLIFLLSLWAAIYTGSVAAALWARRNYRGAVGAGLLAGMVLVIPTAVQVLIKMR